MPDMSLACYLVLGSAFFLILVGLVMIYSASSVSDYVDVGDSAHHLKRQMVWVAVGAVAMCGASRFDYRYLRKTSWLVWGVSLLGLIAVLAMGVERWGARRWLEIGGQSLQPAEFAKLGCILVLASIMSNARKKRRTQEGILLCVAAVLLPIVGLIMFQPDMGTAMAILISSFFVIALGGLGGKQLAGLVVAGVVAVPAMILVAPYRAARLFSFIDPWKDPLGDGYQTIQALYAFGSGGLTGVGLGMSRQKFFYLPAAHTDFIFAIIGEELGLLGTMIVVIAFAVFAWGGFAIVSRVKDPFGRLVAAGLTSMIVAQALMNMAAVTNLMPVTGIPLPLVSFGGSSLVFTMGCIGIILSVARHGSVGVRATSKKGVGTGAGTYERRRDRRAHLSSVVGRRGARIRGV